MAFSMRKVFNNWRFYSFGQEQYIECMANTFNHNLLSLRAANKIVAIFAAVGAIFPLVFEREILKAVIYFVFTLVAVLLGLYTNYRMQKQYADSKFIYVLTVLYYVNVILFGIYMGVWTNPYTRASLYFCFLICALLIFLYSPLFHLCLTIGAMIIFCASSVVCKTQDVWIYDITNAIIAGILSVYFYWHISKLRLGLEISANMLENDRDRYLDQSTIDELTQLRNRRDFAQTFQRYLCNYRSSDDWLCLSICDIDFFKGYNDHYGHPMGDECLRAVGRVLAGLKESMGVYSARVGGEEFALLWFEKDVSHVETVITNTMNLIGALKIPHVKSKASPNISISIGVYAERCGASTDTKAIYDLADKALYTAKESGRNRSIICGNGIEQFQVLPQ